MNARRRASECACNTQHLTCVCCLRTRRLRKRVLPVCVQDTLVRSLRSVRKNVQQIALCHSRSFTTRARDLRSHRVSLYRVTHTQIYVDHSHVNERLENAVLRKRVVLPACSCVQDTFVRSLRGVRILCSCRSHFAIHGRSRRTSANVTKVFTDCVKPVGGVMVNNNKDCKFNGGIYK